MRLDNSSYELDSFLIVLKIKLVRMKFNQQFLLKEFPYQTYTFKDSFLVLTYDVEIVDISSIIFESEYLRHIVVKKRKIKVCEHL